MRRLGVPLLTLLAACNVSPLAATTDAGNPDLAAPRRFQFAAPTTTQVEGLSPLGLVTGDFDSDGYADVVVACSSSSVTGSTGGLDMLLGRWNGTLGPPRHTDFPRLAGSNGPALSVGDFSGDGLLDVAAVQQWDLWLYAGDGRGGLRGRDLGQSATEVTSGDFNGDGHVDLLAVNGDSAELTPLLNDGAGNFRAAPATVSIFPLDLVAADFDRDGVTDLALLGASDIRVLRGARDASFALAHQWPADSPQWLLAPVDLNFDGLPDLAVLGGSWQAGTLYVALSRADGLLAAPRASTAPQGPAFQGSGLVAADLDDNGTDDLAILSENTASILAGDGQGGFGPAETFAIPDLAFIAYCAAADIDGDRRIDLVYTAQKRVAGGYTVFINVLHNTGHLDTGS